MQSEFRMLFTDRSFLCYRGKYCKERFFFKFLGIDYIYSLTSRPEGRLDWRQALFLKLVGDNDQQIGLLKKMTVQQRCHFTDAVPINAAGLDIGRFSIL